MAAKSQTAAKQSVYLDNAATTFCSPEVAETVASWLNRGNPSSSYASALSSRAMMNAFRRALLYDCGIISAKESKDPDIVDRAPYVVVFTSGASEAIAWALTGCVRSQGRADKGAAREVPLLAVSAVEHKAVSECARDLVEDGLARLEVLPVGQFPDPDMGLVRLDALERVLAMEPALVAVMAANNETGIVSNLAAVSELVGDCLRRGLRRPAFHVDAVQVFGKVAFKPQKLGIDSFCVSFHKLGGPPGVGALVLRRELAEAWTPLVAGSQNGGLRGGTENLPGIAGAFRAFQMAVASREGWVEVRRLRDGLVAELGAEPVTQYEMPGSPHSKSPRIYAVLSASSNLLPNVVMLAVDSGEFCNIAARAVLEDAGFIVSTGSACNSGEAAAGASSAVVEALGLPRKLRRTVLRVSLGKDTTPSEIAKFAKAYKTLVARVGV